LETISGFKRNEGMWTMQSYMKLVGKEEKGGFFFREWEKLSSYFASLDVWSLFGF
jgi:hypothetical protein